MIHVRVVASAWPAPSRSPPTAAWTDLGLVLCSNPTLADYFRLQGSHFCQAAQVTRGLTELGGQERLEDVPSRVRSDSAAAHTDDVHVVVLNALARGEVVSHQPGADSRNFVRAHRCTDAATANRHPALDRPSGHSPAEGDDEVGIIVALVQTMCPKVDD